MQARRSLAGVSRWISGLFYALVPDPFVIAVLLTLLAAALSVLIGFKVGMPLGERSMATLDAWRAPDGMWRWLAFGMQMCLVLVSGHAVASSRPVQGLIFRLAALPGTGRSAVVLVAVVAMTASLLNWGLGLIVGALLARDVARACWARGVRVWIGTVECVHC
jgi:short-chain fatty acids transporter